MNSTSERTRSEYFVDRLLALKQKEDRGALATLRRGLQGNQTSYAPLRIIGPWLNHGLKPYELDNYLLVAGLFAFHPEHKKGENLGQSLRSVRYQLSAGQESLDTRFTGLLDADREDLNYLLRQMISMIKSQKKTVPVDYERLVNDLRYWSHPDRFVQRNWALAYYNSPDSETD